MSFIDIPIISSLLFKSSRSIETISGYISINENTKDELEITQQPVQQGAMITDHSFVKPTTLGMQIQFDKTNTLSSLSSAAGGALGSFLGGAATGALGGIVGAAAGGGLSGGDVLAQTYKKLLDLQSSREPFTIATPKRVYNNMLFQSIGLVTDKNTENVLSISATFQEIIIVQVSTTTVPRIVQKNAGRTGKTELAGKKSALLTLKEGIGF